MLPWGTHEAPTIVGAELKNFENMESSEHFQRHFQSLLYLIHTCFGGGFYLDIQNHTVEYPRAQGCMK